MIIMINGAFGVGKTSVTERLVELIPNSLLYDPELVGYMIREVIPERIKPEHERTGDFQDLDIWKELVVTVAKSIKSSYNQHLIVPMTLYKKENFQYISKGLKSLDEATHHFCLMADQETIHRRLLERGETPGAWCFQQTSKCLEAFKAGGFNEYVETVGINADEIAKQIVERLKR
ncbi:AAA family ATPase [Peribacillus acanthi]|uniref:AAA family ATPase n=1 Tax=Peribacillus acanthi TaxID=2171554 RepID=UPI000D3E7744|nr:AAA family ATPase [Peribacillus acanthi]